MKRKRAGEPQAFAFTPGDAIRAKFKADKPAPRFTKRWEGQGYYYPGVVSHVHEDGTLDIMFNDGYFERVLRTLVKRSSHVVLRQWRSSGHPWIGQQIVRHHGTRRFVGKVVCWCPPSTSDSDRVWPKSFHCVHEDDDEETLTENEISEGLKALKPYVTSQVPPPSAAPSAAPSAPSPPPSLPPTLLSTHSSVALGALDRVASTAPTFDSTVQDPCGIGAVVEALRRLRLEQYAHAFEEQGFDDLEYLQQLVCDGGEQFQRLVDSVQLKKGHAAKLRSWLPEVAASVLGVAQRSTR